MQVEVSIVMPCLDEARTVGVCVSKAHGFLVRSGVSGEVIVADNGSIDGSKDIARDAGARVVEIVARGYGSALKGGIKAAQGKYIIMGDADDSYDFAALEKFVELLREGADLVMGNRFAGGIMPGAMPPLHRYLGNPVLSFIGRVFFRTKTGDFHCGLRGFTREAYQRMNIVSDGMEFASEIVLKAGMLDMKILETPVKLYPDGRDRKPHLRSWRDGWRHLKLLFLFCPRWLFLYPCTTLMIAGLATGAALLPGQLRLGNVGLDVHTLFYAGTSLTLGCIGLWFYLFGRIYAQQTGYISKRYSAVDKLANYLTVERGLIAGGTLFVAGVAGSLYALWLWRQQGFADLDPANTLRIVMPSGFAIINGALLAFAAMFLQILRYGKRS